MSNHYPIPQDVLNNPHVKSYVHHGMTGNPLSDEYAHYVRADHPNDKPDESTYYGEWTDVTDADKKQALIKKLAQEKANIERQLTKLRNNKEEE